MVHATRRTRARGRSAVCALVLGALAPLGAQTVPLQLPPGAPFSLRVWNTGSGLPQNSVSGVLQDPDGSMWAATFGGLCRFDGVTWTALDARSAPGCPDSRLTVLHRDADGGIWIGSDLGVVSRLVDGRPVLQCRVPETVVAFGRLPDGRMVAASPRDLYVVGAGGAPRPLYPAPVVGCHVLLELPNGELWSCGTGGVIRLDAEGPARQFDMDSRSGAVHADGSVFVGGLDAVHALRDGRLERVASVRSAPDERLRTLMAGRDGLWFATSSRLGRIDYRSGAPEFAFELPAPVFSLAEDTGGGIWAGMIGAGLARLSPSEMTLLGGDHGLSGPPPDSVLGDGAGGWIVGSSRGLFRGRDGRFEQVGAVDQSVRALHRDERGWLWLGLEDGLGCLRDGRFEPVAGSRGVGVVRALCPDPRGRLWAGTDDGAWVLDGGFAPASSAATLRGTSVKCIRPGHGGDLWVAGALEMLRISTATDTVTGRWVYGRELPLGEVRAVLPHAHGRTWIGMYGGGFVGVDGDRLTRVGPDSGLLDAFVCTVTPLGPHWMVGSNRGAYLVDPAALDRIADGDARGLACRPLVGPYGVAVEANGGVQPSSSSQGDVAAISCVGGLMVVDRNDLRPPGPAPTCSIRIERVGDQRVEHTVGGPRLVATGDRAFVVHLHAVDFERPQLLRYRWRVQPGAADWSAPSREATVAVRLSEPGDYILEAQAVTVDDRHSDRPATARIRIEPRLWEQPWFATVAVLLTLLVGWMAFRTGMRRSSKRARLLERLVDERTIELRNAQEGLEQRVAERTIELRQALQLLKTDHERRTQLERELQKLQRMDSLGQLAGAVAHDFNNLLTIVLSYEALLERMLADRPDELAMASHIREAGERGRRLTQHLLAVASKQAVVPTVVDLASHLVGQRRVLEDLLGDDVRLDLDLGQEALPVRAAPSQLDQILFNLCINARDAQPDGGVVRILARRRGAVAELVVADDGVGMDGDVLQRAFEPFFTTKGRDRGTGLGLATVYGITKQLLGDVEVESKPGRGTSFRFVFPLTDPAPERVVPVPTPVPADAPLSVLLVEDQPPVRAALRHTLELLGCRVVAEAGDGLAAARELAAHRTRVDVVLSDVQMPGPSGLQLVRLLRAECPQVPIVFLSGYAASWQFQSDCEALGVELLAKPPDRRELHDALRRAHRRRAPGSGVPTR
ncbi:MAG: two-component regulator propeller domain-containing protein [Planctomycetota bacterium]